MAGFTLLRFVVDDIAKDLKQTFDDKEIQKSQIAYWVLMIGNRLKSQHIVKRRSQAFVHTFVDVPVETVAVTINPGTVEGRKRITLPNVVYNFDLDRGVDYISYWVNEEVDDKCPPRFTKFTFTRTTPKESSRLYFNDDEKPSPANPYFYVSGNRTGNNFVYFLGVEKVEVKFVEIGIVSAFDPLTTISLDDPFDFPDELLAVLKRQVLDLGRFALLLPEERKNDGENVISPAEIPTQKLVSVNDPVNKSEE